MFSDSQPGPRSGPARWLVALSAAIAISTTGVAVASACNVGGVAAADPQLCPILVPQLQSQNAAARTVQHKSEGGAQYQLGYMHNGQCVAPSPTIAPAAQKAVAQVAPKTHMVTPLAANPTVGAQTGMVAAPAPQPVATAPVVVDPANVAAPIAVPDTTVTTIVAPPVQAVTATNGGQVQQGISNWGGYAATGATFNSVSGTWVQPSGTCQGANTQIAGFWVGLDGANSNGVEQTGTTFACNAGQPMAYAWYEFFPAPPVYLPAAYAVAAGDAVSGSVVNNGGNFTVALSDMSTTHQPWTFTTTAAVPNAPATSAEWVIEAPAVGNTSLNASLPNFGSVSFMNCAATVAGVPQPISAFSAIQLELADNGGHIRAMPSSLGLDGTSFSVSYLPQ